MGQVQTYYWPELADKKLSWGEGPWGEEPDKVVWKDEATGYPCLIRRHARRGFLCGYVGVPPEHPLYEEHFSTLDVEVHHSGLSFSDECDPDEDEAHAICHIAEPGDPDNVWWFGFDCAHIFDHAPADQEYILGSEEVYRDVSYVQDQCKQLAWQLKDLEKKN